MTIKCNSVQRQYAIKVPKNKDNLVIDIINKLNSYNEIMIGLFVRKISYWNTHQEQRKHCWFFWRYNKTRTHTKSKCWFIQIMISLLKWQLYLNIWKKTYTHQLSLWNISSLFMFIKKSFKFPIQPHTKTFSMLIILKIMKI